MNNETIGLILKIVKYLLLNKRNIYCRFVMPRLHQFIPSKFLKTRLHQPNMLRGNARAQHACCAHQATCCPQHVACCPQQVARPRNLLPRNMLLRPRVTSNFLRASSNLLPATCCLLPATSCSSAQLVAAQHVVLV